jgi:hypothetical protein
MLTVRGGRYQAVFASVFQWESPSGRVEPTQVPNRPRQPAAPALGFRREKLRMSQSTVVGVAAERINKFPGNDKASRKAKGLLERQKDRKQDLDSCGRGWPGAPRERGARELEGLS